MALSFKSVGVTAQDRQFKTARESTPIGFKTPLRLGTTRTGLLDMHLDIRDQIHDNLRNLLLTNHGERLGLYGFGSNLRPLATERVSKDDFDEEAMLRILDSVKKYMPFVELDDFDSTIELINKPYSMVKAAIVVTYNVPRLRVVGKKIGVVIWGIG